MLVAAGPPLLAIVFALGALGWLGFRLNLFLNVMTPRLAGTEDVTRELRTSAIATTIGAIFDPFAQGPQPADPPQPRRYAMSKTVDLAAEPYAFALVPEHCALLIIDMQRDFLEPGGFGEMLGNDVAQLRRTIEPNRRLLAAWRASGLPALHTREGHRPDLSDLPPAKKVRGRSAATIGDAGPMGRILVRGEAGHDIIPELYPAPGEPVIDKPGKGAFHATDLNAILQHRDVKQLVVTGVTTEVCVNTTVREANDRGYDCLVLRRRRRALFPGRAGRPDRDCGGYAHRLGFEHFGSRLWWLERHQRRRRLLAFRLLVSDTRRGPH
jgi:nicotinamidase-related amidase